MDKAANVGVGIGKRSFTPAQILENASNVIEAVARQACFIQRPLYPHCNPLFVDEPAVRIAEMSTANTKPEHLHES